MTCADDIIYQIKHNTWNRVTQSRNEKKTLQDFPRPQEETSFQKN